MTRPAEQGLAAAALAQQTDERKASIQESQKAIDEARAQITAIQAAQKKEVH